MKTNSTFEVEHGRQERRNYAVTDDVSWLVAGHPAWNTIKSIDVVESIRMVGEVVTTEQRYYISSLPADPVMFGTSVRAHWGIENSLHYVLDVAFGEDAAMGLRIGRLSVRSHFPWHDRILIQKEALPVESNRWPGPITILSNYYSNRDLSIKRKLWRLFPKHF